MGGSAFEAFRLQSGKASFEGSHLCLHFVRSGSAIGLRDLHRHPIVEGAYLIQNLGSPHSILSDAEPVLSVCLPEAMVREERFSECSTPSDFRVDRALSNFLVSLSEGEKAERMFWATEIVRALVEARDRSPEKFYLRIPHDHDRYAGEMKISREYILARLDRPISLEGIASACALSPFHFHRVFRRWHGVTPGNYIATERVRRACRKLVLTDEKFSVISKRCGFRSPTSFAGVFKSMTGFTPAGFRQMAAHHRSELRIFLQ